MASSEEAGRRGHSDTRRDIVEAALGCFTRKGYNKTTMDDIVAESGLSKGTLYWYFDSKEDLFGAALLSVFERFGDEIMPVTARCDSASEKLRYLSRATAEFSESVGGYFSLFLEFWASSPSRGAATKVWYDLLIEYKTVLSTILSEGIEAGEFGPVDRESLTWALLAAYDGLAAYAGFIPDLDLERIGETFTAVVLRGLARRGDEKAEWVGNRDERILGDASDH